VEITVNKYPIYIVKCYLPKKQRGKVQNEWNSVPTDRNNEHNVM
jgi:hypothetical protein